MRNGALRYAKAEEATASVEGDRVGSGMQRWRREFPDVDCSGKAVVGRLLHVHEIFLKAINRTLAKHRLKYPAFAVLATLRVEGAALSMSPKQLLDSLILTSGGLSNLLRSWKRRAIFVAWPTNGRTRSNRRVDRAGTPARRARDARSCGDRAKACRGIVKGRAACRCVRTRTDDAQIDSGSTWLSTRAREPRSAGSTTAPGYCSCHRTVTI